MGSVDCEHVVEKLGELVQKSCLCCDQGGPRPAGGLGDGFMFRVAVGQHGNVRRPRILAELGDDRAQVAIPQGKFRHHDQGLFRPDQAGKVRGFLGLGDSPPEVGQSPGKATAGHEFFVENDGQRTCHAAVKMGDEGTEGTKNSALPRMPPATRVGGGQRCPAGPTLKPCFGHA